MGLFDGIGKAIGFGQSEQSSKSSTDNWNAGQKGVASKLTDFFSNRIGKPGTRYAGNRVAGMSAPESSAQNWLQGYMNQDKPKQFDWANTNLKNVMQGNYSNPIVDPSKTAALNQWAKGQATGPMADAQSKDIVSDEATNALFERIKDKTLRDLPELQNTLAGNANLSGMYFSGGHHKNQNDLLKDTSAQLLDTLAQLKYGDEQQRRALDTTREARMYDTLDRIMGSGLNQGYEDIRTEQNVGREREGRQFSSIPLAMDVGRTEDSIPLSRAAAGQTYGAQPRELEQQRLDAAFTDFLRTLPENNQAIMQALAFLGQTGTSTTKAKGEGSQGAGEAMMNPLGAIL